MPTQLTFGELLNRSRNEAVGDVAWLGSQAHLQLLREGLTDTFGLHDVSLRWVPPGEPGYWEAASGEISLERPLASSTAAPELLAEMTTLSLLHECLHARYSTPSGAYRTAKQQMPPILHRATERLFQVLEDGRITALARADQPELQDGLAIFIAASTHQAVAISGKSGEGIAPESRANQLFHAVEVYALEPESRLQLHPEVQSEFPRLIPAVDRTRSGDTEGCGLAAVEIVRAITSARLDS